MHQREFDFSDLAPATCTVKYEGKLYIGRTADADTAAKYRSIILKSRRHTADGLFVVNDGSQVDAGFVLLTGAFREVQKGSEEYPIPESVVRLWPEPMVQKLIDWTKRVSDIDQPDTVEMLTELIEEYQRRKTALLKLRKEQNGSDFTNASRESTLTTSS